MSFEYILPFFFLFLFLPFIDGDTINLVFDWSYPLYKKIITVFNAKKKKLFCFSYKKEPIIAMLGMELDELISSIFSNK